MARRKVVDLTADKVVGFGIKPGDKKVGEEVSGFYIGSKKVQTGMGPSTIHVLQSPDTGENLGLWGSAQLNAKLAQVEKGILVFVKYLKKIKVPKGTMKTFEVEYDDEQKIEVAGTEVNFSPSSEEADSEADAEANDYTSEELDAAAEESAEEIEAPPARAATTARRPASGATAISAQSRARATELMSKKR